MEKQTISINEGDKVGRIDDLIKFLVNSKNNGATHYQMTWSKDPNWAFKWIETYKVKSDQELNDERIKELEAELAKLKNKNN
jgi:uncharacterized protein with ACT and thioredoxin-like domain